MMTFTALASTFAMNAYASEKNLNSDTGSQSSPTTDDKQIKSKDLNLNQGPSGRINDCVEPLGCPPNPPPANIKKAQDPNCPPGMHIELIDVDFTCVPDNQ